MAHKGPVLDLCSVPAAGGCARLSYGSAELADTNIPAGREETVIYNHSKSSLSLPIQKGMDFLYNTCTPYTEAIQIHSLDSSA